MNDKPTILLVEDEPDQAALIRDALLEEPNWDLRHVTTGEAAVAYLEGTDPYADRAAHPFPFVMLLDLIMPGMGGLGVLRWLQDHPDTAQRLTTVVHSSVDSSREIEQAGKLGANIYWVKSDWMLLRQRLKLLKASLS